MKAEHALSRGKLTSLELESEEAHASAKRMPKLDVEKAILQEELEFDRGNKLMLEAQVGGPAHWTRERLRADGKISDCDEVMLERLKVASEKLPSPLTNVETFVKAGPGEVAGEIDTREIDLEISAEESDFRFEATGG
ncbi:protein RecA [Striga asiatica]|uniref:Protein RecA n=1 Tax=Striga asiatica TaxID=4170 RepID=A0A5A7PXE8_STRAF|nr:protein RecA [Striga asiatica]